MKLNSITNRYVFKELFAPFSINIFVFAFLFLMTEMIEIANWIVNYNLSVWDVLTIIFYTMPAFLIYIIPMSVMLAILLTFLRLSSDNEIVAIKSCGMSIYGLLPPVLLFAILGFLLTIFMTLYGVPRSKASLEEMTLEVAASNADIGLKERTFNDTFKGVMLFINKIDVKNRNYTSASEQLRRTRIGKSTTGAHTTLAGIRSFTQNGYTRIVFDMTAKTPFNDAAIKGPARIFIDLMDTDIARALPKVIRLSRGPVASIRTARNSDKTTSRWFSVSEDRAGGSSDQPPPLPPSDRHRRGAPTSDPHRHHQTESDRTA